MNNKRFYNFILVIYEDDKDFKQQFANLQINYASIFIRHDKDVYENDEVDEKGKIIHNAGDLKKPHYHFIIKLKNAKTISAISKDSLVAEHMIEPVKKSFDGALRYLIHYGRDDKYQYSEDDVKSYDDKLLRRFQKAVNNDMTEEEKTEKIEDFIHNSGRFIEFKDLGAYVRKIGKWDAFRRNMSYFQRILDEHNNKFIKLR